MFQGLVMNYKRHFVVSSGNPKDFRSWYWENRLKPKYIFLLIQQYHTGCMIILYLTFWETHRTFTISHSQQQWRKIPISPHPHQPLLFSVLFFIIAFFGSQVKNLLEMQETRVWSLGWEDPLEKGMVTTPVFLPGKFLAQRSLAGYNTCNHKESDMTERLSTHIQPLQRSWAFHFIC